MVRGAAEGDKQAWERLVDQYARIIWAASSFSSHSANHDSTGPSAQPSVAAIFRYRVTA